MLNRVRAFSFLLLVIISLEGCVTAGHDEAMAFHETERDQADREPRLRAGDRVQVTVFGEQAVTGAYDVSPSGTLQLPLAGSVDAAGKTARDLEASIADSLHRKYLRDPNVTVAVLTLRPFYVLGEVEKPGEYPYRSGLDIWRAMAIAGGQTYRASASSVFIQHADETQVAEYDLTQDVSVRPGDLIRVPERWF